VLINIKKNTKMITTTFKLNLLFLKNLIVKFLVGKKACR